MVVLSEIHKSYGRLRLFVNGEWIGSKTTQIQPVMNPAKDEVIAEILSALRDEVNKAVEAAVGSFEKRRELPVPKRVQYIYRMKSKLEEHFEEISRISTQNHGKIIDESRGSNAEVSLVAVCSHPFPFVILGEQFIPFLLAAVGLIVFFGALQRFTCSRCVNFSCFLNQVPKKLVDEYLKRNLVMRKVWEENGWQITN